MKSTRSVLFAPPPPRCSSVVRMASPSQDHISTSAAHQLQRVAGYVAAGIVAASMLTSGAMARPEGVNRPDLLPKGPVTPVIDVAGFLTPSEEKRIFDEVTSLERDTGFRLRVLAQNYPDTPGQAIREYWKVDPNTIVFVADPTFGDILNFNVGGNLDLEIPKSFWGRLAGKYGNKFFWQERGESVSILNAVSAIDTCLREEQGRLKCATVQEEFGVESIPGPFGNIFKQLD